MKSVGVTRNGRIDFVFAGFVRNYFFTVLEEFTLRRVFRRYDGDIELYGKLFSAVSCGYGNFRLTFAHAYNLTVFNLYGFAIGNRVKRVFGSGNNRFACFKLSVDNRALENFDRSFFGNSR